MKKNSLGELAKDLKRTCSQDAKVSAPTCGVAVRCASSKKRVYVNGQVADPTVLVSTLEIAGSLPFGRIVSSITMRVRLDTHLAYLISSGTYFVIFFAFYNNHTWLKTG